jgi:hypothetical protein
MNWNDKNKVWGFLRGLYYLKVVSLDEMWEVLNEFE